VFDIRTHSNKFIKSLTIVGGGRIEYFRYILGLHVWQCNYYIATIIDIIHSYYGNNRSRLTMSYNERKGFGGRGGSFGSSPKPVEMGKEYEVEISEISKRGDGIARIQGFVIFVAGAKAGQKTNIRITSIGDRFAKAEVV
jgi:predicted RNA-binding protein with TRAM domain